MARKLGPYTRRDLPMHLDGRTREAAVMRGFRTDLVRFVGGNPDLIQGALIHRACVLHLRLAMLDRKLMQATDMTLHDNNHYIAWTNAYRRTLLAVVGMAESPSSDLTVEEALARIHAAADAVAEEEGADAAA
jgi:hypothetical protein